MTTGNNEPATTTQAAKTFSEEDFNKAVGKAQTEQARAVDLEKKLERFKDIDPDAVKAMREDYELMRTERAAKGGKDDIEKLVNERTAEIKSRAETAVAEKAKEVETWQTRATRAEVLNPALTAAPKYLNATGIKLLSKQFESDLRSIDGKIVAVGGDGKPLASQKGTKLDSMGLEEYLELKAAEFPDVANPKFVKGSGGVSLGTTTSKGEDPSKADVTYADVAALASNPAKQREFLNGLTQEQRNKVLLSAGF